MRRVLIVECQQEVSSFNPVPSGYGDFQINRGAQLSKARRRTQTYVGGALAVLEARRDVEAVPVYGAFACSAGILAADGFARLARELLDGLATAAAGGVDLVYFALHGAMSAEGEQDPEGFILARARALLGPDVPFVTSLDLHGIATGQMLRHSPAMVTLKTYPHVDLDDTGARAARLALHLLDTGAAPVAARIRLPMLVRGDKLKTETGLYGRFLERAAAIEQETGILAATLMIGNPFTDVPELCCQGIVVADGDRGQASEAVHRLVDGFYDRRAELQARLVPLDAAIATARSARGKVIFTDAAHRVGLSRQGAGAADRCPGRGPRRRRRHRRKARLRARRQPRPALRQAGDRGRGRHAVGRQLRAGKLGDAGVRRAYCRAARRQRHAGGDQPAGPAVRPLAVPGPWLRPAAL